MTTANTTYDPQYENLQELIDNEASGWEKKHEVDLSDGKVWKLNNSEQRISNTHTNVGEFLDSVIRKNATKIASIIDIAEDVSARPAIALPYVFNTMGDFWRFFLTTGATNALDTINLYLNPDTAVSARPGRNAMEYEYEMPAWTWTTIGILELMEELYSSQKIAINNLDVATNKIIKDRERAEKKTEREAMRTNNPTNTSGTPAGSPSILQETHEDLNVPQIQASLNFAKANKKTGSAYSFDKKWFPVRYEKNSSGVETYFACIQDESGNVTEIWATNPSELIRNIINTTKKTKEQKEFAETVDMEKSFSRIKFAELCTAVSKSKGRRGEYKIDGKNYFVHENINTTVTPHAYFTPPQYTVSYPGAGETMTTSTPLNLHGHPTPPTTDNLISLLESHDGIYNSHHDFDREHLLQKIKELKGLMGKKTTYVINGHTYHMWSKRLSGGWKMKYYAEIPAGAHGKTTVSALTVEWLYNKIIDKVQNSHGHEEKKEEHSEHNKSHEHKEWHEKHEHGSHDDHWHKHEHKSGSFYDRTVEKIFGNGLLGKALIWPKNQIPKPLRSLGGNTVAAWVTWGVVWGVVAGAGWALWSAALSSAVVPAIWITFTASMVNRFLKWRKWWPHNKDESGGNEHWHGWH